MSTIKNNINTYQNLAVYDSDMGKDYPNVSYLIDEDEVKWVKDDPLLVVIYNVTSTSSTTTLLNSNTSITYQIIDGVQQQSVQRTYTFNTLGEHTVKYKLSGTSVGNSTFSFCNKLKNITLPNGTTAIGDTAFNYSSLTSVIIPSSVTSIGSQAFSGCSGLTSITVEATTPPTLKNANAFSLTNCPIYVPSESLNTYKSASGWSSYASIIQAIP